MSINIEKQIKNQMEFNANQDEVGFVLDMALKNLGRMSGRLHFLAQIQVTTQAVKAIYSQEGYWKNLLYDHKMICQDVFLKTPMG